MYCRLAPFLTLLALCTLMTGCQPQAIPESQSDSETKTPSAWPEADYDNSALAGKSVFKLDPNASRIEVLVRRDGPLARFGHDHVLVARETEGFLLLADPPHGSRADLRIEVEKIDVDPDEARRRYRLDSEPDYEDISATRENLLLRVLESPRWPYILVGISGWEKNDGSQSAMMEIRVKDSILSRRVGFGLKFDEGNVVIDGSFTLRQTELGIEPFSVFGGGLRVADELEFHFSLQGRPISPHIAQRIRDLQYSW